MNRQKRPEVHCGIRDRLESLEARDVPATLTVASTLDGQVMAYALNGGGVVATFRAFEGQFGGEVHAVAGDVNGDGFDDVIVAPGVGGGPRIQIFDGKSLTSNNQKQLASFYAYDPAFAGGVSVAVGDVNGDGYADVITGAGPGAGPHVKVFSGLSIAGGAPLVIASFYAYDPAYSGGVNVASGNMNGDIYKEVVVSSAAVASHVTVWDGLALSSGALFERASFYAFDPAFAGGVSVGMGDVNGDGRADLIVGLGAGGGPQVKVFSGFALANGTQTELANFLAFDPSFAGGVAVTSRDLNFDGHADVIVGAGAGGQNSITQFDGFSLSGGAAAVIRSFTAFDTRTDGAVFVG